MNVELNKIPELNPSEIAQQELHEIRKELEVVDVDKELLFSALENSNYLQTGIEIRLRGGLPLDKVA